ncbi:MAG: hypothetical protein ACYC9L_15535 [Sulfuricaulis sp.]
MTERLLVARIPECKIHVIAADDQVLVDHHLPRANLLQETDVVPAVERGVAVGGITGVLAGVVAIALPGVGLGLGAGRRRGFVNGSCGRRLWRCRGADVGYFCTELAGRNIS